jgi:hypothetical protein
LDIDDCLNTDRSIAAAGGHADTATVPGVSIPFHGDPVGAQLINRACRLSGARIVISSSWIAAVGLEYTQAWLMNTGISADLYADPPAIDISDPDSDGKRDGMLAYISQHKIDPRDCVVVDDDEWMFLKDDPLINRQVIIGPEEGITLENYRLILRFLGGRDKENGVF